MGNDLGGMGFSRVQGDFIDLHNPSLQQHNIILEVVVVDLTRHVKTVYQFNKDSTFTSEELMDIKRGALSPSHDAFQPIGEAAEIHKDTKQIILTDGNTITYHHLITVTGKQPTILSYEFMSGLHTLIDALRVSKTLNASLNNRSSGKQDFSVAVSVDSKKSELIDDLGAFTLPVKRPEQATVLVSELNQKLFQIQI